jgi:SNF2 family DNA or RNA helicase
MLWKHQQQMLNHSNSLLYSLSYAGMGTGKTLYALTYLNQFNGMKLVICPKPAIVAWQDDIRDFMTGIDTLILNKGNSKSKAEKLLYAADSGQNIIVIVNYETARLLPLHYVNWSAVVLDEGQRIGKYNSKQTLAITRMLEGKPNKVIMTGTPYNDGYERLYSMFRFFDG